MGNLNRIFLMGNLTRDVEIRHTAGNTAVGKFGIAVNRRFTTADGEKREEVMFVDCEAWGRTAENISRFFQKGRPIFIEGRLKLDQWEDKETKAKRSRHVVVVEGFEFVDSGNRGGGEEGGAPRSSTRPAAASPNWNSGAAPEVQEEDIPF